MGNTYKIGIHLYRKTYWLCLHARFPTLRNNFQQWLHRLPVSTVTQINLTAGIDWHYSECWGAYKAVGFLSLCKLRFHGDIHNNHFMLCRPLCTNWLHFDWTGAFGLFLKSCCKCDVDVCPPLISYWLIWPLLFSDKLVRIILQSRWESLSLMQFLIK